MNEAAISLKNIFNEKCAIIEYPLHILASKDAQKYFCAAHPNNLGEKYQQIRLIRFCTI